MKKAVFAKTFLKNLKRLDEKTKAKVKSKIQQILIEPHCGVPLKKPLKPFFKVRYGKYRVIYRFDEKYVYFVSINHRKSVYNRLN